MTTSETPMQIRYVVNAKGEKTDVVIPVTTWEKMLLSLKEVLEIEEDKTDLAILQDWLQHRAAAATEAVSLDELEQELLADGLLPG